MKALIFDCDGVILESEELHRIAYNAAFEHFDMRVRLDALPLLLRDTVAPIVELLLSP